MTKWILFHNPQCSKSREALNLLRSRNVEPLIIEYLKNPPTESELRDLIKKLQEPISGLVRVKEEEFQNEKFDLSSLEEVIKQLAKKPRLLERPIVIKDEVAVIARPIEKIEKLF